MTNYERLTSSIDKAAEVLCRFFEKAECENCPAYRFCYKGNNGMKHWLMSEGGRRDENGEMER